uniref:Uncharacterized protein n=1 Tax=Ananas comosus var. bracteatus TaxID=296719 RepID=A0A6V7NFE7_ANACO|nr:unnamed protein product [Ananas comosus var. bracteatus]
MILSSTGFEQSITNVVVHFLFPPSSSPCPCSPSSSRRLSRSLPSKEEEEKKKRLGQALGLEVAEAEAARLCPAHSRSRWRPHTPPFSPPTLPRPCCYLLFFSLRPSSTAFAALCDGNEDGNAFSRSSAFALHLYYSRFCTHQTHFWEPAVHTTLSTTKRKRFSTPRSSPAREGARGHPPTPKGSDERSFGDVGGEEGEECTGVSLD